MERKETGDIEGKKVKRSMHARKGAGKRRQNSREATHEGQFVLCDKCGSILQ